MSDLAIDINGLSKVFEIPHEKRSTLAQSIIGAITKGNVKYETLLALRKVDLKVKKGEFVGIIGPNGSGKSTLLKAIAGILEPDSGTVKVEGKVIPLLELGLGFVPDLTAKENIYLYGSLLGLSKDDVSERKAKLLKFAGLARFEDTPIKDYSSGMLARLAFSIAKEAEGDIYLVDEVLAVGDADFQKKCLLVFEDFRRRGKTVIFVSHSQDLMRKVCDRLVLLESGRITKQLSVSDMQSQDGSQRENPEFNHTISSLIKKSKTEVDGMMSALGFGKVEEAWARRVLQGKDDIIRVLKIEHDTISGNFKVAQKDLAEKRALIRRLEKEAAGLHKRIVEVDAKPNDYAVYRRIFSMGRTGSGEASIRKVTAHSKDGVVCIQMRYFASKSLDDAEIGFAITTPDMVFIAGPNSSESQAAGKGFSLKKGEGVVEYSAKLGLNSGTYVVHAAISRKSKPGVQNGYDFMPNACEFKVEGPKKYGLVSTAGSWKFNN